MFYPEELEQIETIFKYSKNQYSFLHRKKDIYETEAYLESAHILSHYEYFEIGDLFGGSHPEIHFTMVKVGYNIPNGKHNLGGVDMQLIATKKLDKGYGHILIRPETWEDKFREIFYSLELDFEQHKQFSTDHYFLSEDKESGHQFATDRRLQLISETPGIFIEVKGHRLVAKFPKNITPELALSLIRFTENI